MTDEPEDGAPKPATQTMSELVARRQAALKGNPGGATRGGERQSERAAAARSASKSKPAQRK